MVICKNCGTQTNDVYCSHCGQKAIPERITFHYLTHEIIHFFTHAEKGFFFTTWRLVKEPGRTIEGFIDGKRKNLQKPVSYFLIWIAIYSLVLYGLEKFYGENKVVSFVDYFGPGEKTKFAISHLNIVLTLLLPIQAVYVYLFLFRPRYNYVEALVFGLYAIGTIIFLQNLFVTGSLIYYLITGNSVSILLSDILKVLYISWLLIDLARNLSIKAKYVRAIAVAILLMGTFTAWRLYVSPNMTNVFFK